MGSLSQKCFRRAKIGMAGLKKHWYLRHDLPKLVGERRGLMDTGSIIIHQIRDSTLAYVRSNQCPEIGPGVYSYRLGGAPVLYASAYAALTRHLCGDLDSLSTSDRRQWIEYILQHQSDDGLFRDPLIACERAESMDWWGWRHMTLHLLMALGALGGIASKSFRSIEPFRTPGRMIEWLESRGWKTDASCVSNEVQNYATMLQYARDFQEERWCSDALEEMYNWLDRHQNPRTGYWHYGKSTPRERSLGIQTGYHFWCLYFYDRRPMNHIDRIIDGCLATQNRLGGYGVPLNSSACEDIDSIDPLVRLTLLTDYRRDDVRMSLEKAMVWVLANYNPSDGGWVFRRYDPYSIVPHEAMWGKAEESIMPYAWFRTLSLAYIAQALPRSVVAEVDWRFSHFPGHQFWH